MKDVKVKCLWGMTVMMFVGATMMAQPRNIIGTFGPRETHKPTTENLIDRISGLARTITANSQTDSEKAYAIYRWITSHIKYDNGLRYSEELQRKIYVSEKNVVENVLDRKMALCGGYAFLFRDLCEIVNIPVEVIHGYTKINGALVEDYGRPIHTWNAVKLDGEWHLLDITWAVGFGSGHKPDDFWYLSHPRDFIYSHYPKNPKWTLLNNSISFQEFKRR